MSLTAKDIRGFQLAHTAAEMSPDPSLRVGACVMSPNAKVLGVGCNTFAQGVKVTDERLHDRDVKLRLIIHAEEQALIRSGGFQRNGTIYSTQFPCAHCAAVIIEYGIQHVMAEVTEYYLQRWRDDVELSKTQFREAGVLFQVFQRDR